MTRLQHQPAHLARYYSEADLDRIKWDEYKWSRPTCHTYPPPCPLPCSFDNLPCPGTTRGIR